MYIHEFKYEYMYTVYYMYTHIHWNMQVEAIHKIECWGVLVTQTINMQRRVLVELFDAPHVVDVPDQLQN